MARAKKQVFVVHGSGVPRRRRGSIYWKPKLEDGLGAEYRVSCPQMPDPDNPQHVTWKNAIDRRIARLPAGSLILVGHSFGGSTLLKHLSEQPLERSVSGLFLVATPCWKRRGWQREYALPRDISKLSQVPRIFLYHSRDDEEVPFAHLARLARRIPRATVRRLDGRGHEFLDDHFPELVSDIKNL